MLENTKNPMFRGVAPTVAEKWNIEVPNEPGKVGVAYIIDANFSGGEQTIHNGMDEIEANSCIRQPMITFVTNNVSNNEMQSDLPNAVYNFFI